MKVICRLDAFDSGAYYDHFYALVNCDIAVATNSVEVTPISYCGKELVRQLDETKPCVWQRNKNQNNHYVHWLYLYCEGNIYRRLIPTGTWEKADREIQEFINATECMNNVLSSILLG